MGQMGFFDLGNRYSGLDAKNEPLLKIDGKTCARVLGGVAACGQGAFAGGTQAVGCDCDVQDDHSVRALQSLGRPS